MFDELGNGWPKHACFDRQYSALKTRVLPILKKGADPRSATFQPFAGLAEQFGFEVPIGAEAPIPVSKDRKSPGPPKPVVAEHTIKKMDPMEGDEASFVGVVRERATGTARLKALYAELGSFGKKVFGLPPANRAVQLTIVEAEGEPNESYSCVADAADLDASVAMGVMVWIKMVGHCTPSASAWVVQEMHAI